MAIKINKKIVGYGIAEPDKNEPVEEAANNVFQLGEPLDRPEKITGTT
jgi:hypothetical protein